MKFLLIPLMLGFLLAAPAASASPQEDRSLQAEGDFDLVLPSELRHLMIRQPKAAVLVVVNQEGQLSDLMPYSAMHYALLEKAEEAVRAAEFTPEVNDGKPVVKRAFVHVSFYDPEQRAWREGGIVAPMGGTASEAAARRIYNASKEKFVYGESAIEELDEPLSIETSDVQVFRDEDGEVPAGSVVMEYYIGPEGNPHFPRVLSSDHERLSLSAIMTLRNTRFAPPRRNGNPTWVRVRQPFNYD
jgi:hypothetical protein